MPQLPALPSIQTHPEDDASDSVPMVFVMPVACQSDSEMSEASLPGDGGSKAEADGRGVEIDPLLTNGSRGVNYSAYC